MRHGAIDNIADVLDVCALAIYVEAQIDSDGVLDPDALLTSRRGSGSLTSRDGKNGGAGNLTSPRHGNHLASRNASGRLPINAGGGSLTSRGASGRLPINAGGGSLASRGASGRLRLPINAGGGSLTSRGASGRLPINAGGGSLTSRGASERLRLPINAGGGSLTSRGASGRLPINAGGGSLTSRGAIGRTPINVGSGSLSSRGGSGNLTSRNVSVEALAHQSQVWAGARAGADQAIAAATAGRDNQSWSTFWARRSSFLAKATEHLETQCSADEAFSRLAELLPEAWLENADATQFGEWEDQVRRERGRAATRTTQRRGVPWHVLA